MTGHTIVHRLLLQLYLHQWDISSTDLTYLSALIAIVLHSLIAGVLNSHEVMWVQLCILQESSIYSLCKMQEVEYLITKIFPLCSTGCCKYMYLGFSCHVIYDICMSMWVCCLLTMPLRNSFIPDVFTSSIWNKIVLGVPTKQTVPSAMYRTYNMQLTKCQCAPFHSSLLFLEFVSAIVFSICFQTCHI